MNVPKGIVLSTFAFQNHLEAHAELKQNVEGLQNASNQLCKSKLNTEERDKLEKEKEPAKKYNKKTLIRII